MDQGTQPLQGGKGKGQDSPWSFQKEGSHANTVVLAQ